MGDNLRAAFKNWSAQLGVIITVAGLMSFLARTLAISVGEPVRVLIETFRGLFHPIIDFPLSLFGFSLTDPQKDAVLIWMAIGGAVGRTLTALYATNIQGREFLVSTRIGEVINYFASSPLRRALITVASFVIWPILLSFGLQWPVVVTHGDSVTILQRNPMSSAAKVVCDLRAILLIQILTVAIALVALVAVSVITD